MDGRRREPDSSCHGRSAARFNAIAYDAGFGI
jgi:hypothetical protein